MIEEINGALESLCYFLGEDGTNYVVDIRLFSATGTAGRSVAETARKALGHEVAVGRTGPAVPADVLQGIREGLEYEGDYGAHPGQAFLGSAEFRSREAEVLGYFERLLSGAVQVISFELEEGHPFYPVHWDFAYVIEKGVDSHVLIGSSSD